MAAISIAINAGNDGFRVNDFTVGTAAPSASTDIELRWNTTDQNSNAITRKQVDIALKAFARAILSDAIFITPPGL